MLPEKLASEGGVGGGALGAPVTAMVLVEGARAAQALPLARLEPVVRLVEPAPPAPAPVVERPILLTSVVTLPAEGAGWCGGALRAARESAGITLTQLADRTKVTRYHLEHIENDCYDRLPSYVYLRGILLSVAKELRLDAHKVTRSYLELAERAAEARQG